MSVTLYSSADFAITTTDVNIQETFQVAKSSHDTVTLSIPFDKWNTSMQTVKLDVSGNARTIEGALDADLLNFICNPASTGCSTFGASNERSLQDLYMGGISMSLYAAGATDSQTHKSIGKAQILAGSGVPVAAGDVASASTFSEALFKNAGALIKEALSVFNASVNANRTAATNNWLHELLHDAHENTGTRALTEATTGDAADDDKVKIKLAAGDAVHLYFRMTSDTDDGILGTSRTDSAEQSSPLYTNPALDSVRLNVILSLV